MMDKKKSINAILFLNKSLGIKTIEILVQNNIKPVFLGSYYLGKSDLIKDCVFYDVHNCMLGEFPEELSRRGFNPQVPDPKLLTDLVECQQIVIPMLERLNYFGKRSIRLINIYHQYVSNWLGILDSLKPDVLIYSGTPHEGFDFVGYFLARYFGVHTVIAERTLIEDRFFLIENIYKYPKYCSELNGGFDEGSGNKFLFDYKKEQNELACKENKSVKERPYLKKIVRLVLGVFQPFEFLKKVQALLDRPFDSVFGLIKQQPRLYQQLIYYNKELIKSRGLEEYYIKQCGRVDLNDKYVFFPLNMQPERTTNPLGGAYFWNLEYVLDVLLTSLPNGWKIYIKEHPRQFSRALLKFSLARNIEFYEKMSSDPRVFFINPKRDSYDLMSHSKCVAVVSGTLGWEAISNGKPIALFGYPWYRECPGVFHVSSIDKLKQYLIGIDKGSVSIDLEKISLYSGWVKNVSGYKGSLNKNLPSSLSDSESAECFAHAITDYISKLK